MNRKTVYVASFSVLMVVVMGLIVLMGGLHDIARWGGYANAMVPMTIFILFLIGSGIVSMTRPNRR